MFNRSSTAACNDARSETWDRTQWRNYRFVKPLMRAA
jgi:hypothetical protein